MRDDNEEGQAEERIEDAALSGPVALLLTQAHLLEQRARDAERDAMFHSNKAITLDQRAAQLHKKAAELLQAAQRLA